MNQLIINGGGLRLPSPWQCFKTLKSYKAPLEEQFRYLGLLKLLVVVGLQFDQRAKDVLVLVGILITQQHMLGLLVHSRFLQVFQGGSGVVLSVDKVEKS